MMCQKCGGLCVEAVCFDLAGDGRAWVQSRCVNCGHYDDPVMRANRSAPVLNLRRKNPGRVADYARAQAVGL